jgi:hypothetical protein
LHELDIGGEPLAVFYIEPNIAGADALTAHPQYARSERRFGRHGRSFVHARPLRRSLQSNGLRELWTI